MPAKSLVGMMGLQCVKQRSGAATATVVGLRVNGQERTGDSDQH